MTTNIDLANQKGYRKQDMLDATNDANERREELDDFTRPTGLLDNRRDGGRKKLERPGWIKGRKM